MSFVKRSNLSKSLREDTDMRFSAEAISELEGLLEIIVPEIGYIAGERARQRDVKTVAKMDMIDAVSYWASRFSGRS